MSAQTAQSPAHTIKPSFADPEDRLEAALGRLRRATEMVEAAVQRRDVARKSATTLEHELQVLFEDRSKLVHELDQVKAKASRLDAASAEVSARLDTVMSNLRTMLAAT